MRQHKYARFRVLVPVLWFVLVFWEEWYTPKHAIRNCKWPQTAEMVESVKNGEELTHIALVADPQIIDDYSYPGRPGLLLHVTKYFTDRHVAKNWRLINQQLKPSETFFLGDLFDGGRGWSDAVWLKEYRRFSTIFPSPRDKDNQTTVHFNIPGNHDIGYGNDMIVGASERFAEHFGPANQEFPVGKYHSIVTLDTIALTNENSLQANKLAETFLQRFASDRRIVLLTHVPLYRPEQASCGPKREAKAPGLKWTRGHQYETEISPQLTERILRQTGAVLVFSGDDHDACEYRHQYSLATNKKVTAPEYTVKSLSMAMGVRRPGFELLTLGKDTEETRICLTSDPFRPFVVLGSAAMLTFVVSVYRHLSHRPKSYVDEVDSPAFKAKATLNSAQRSRIRGMVIGDLLLCFGSFALAELIVTRWIYSSL